MSNQHFRINGLQYKLGGRLYYSKQMDTKIYQSVSGDVYHLINFTMGRMSFTNSVEAELRAIKEAERLRKWRATMKARYGK